MDDQASQSNQPEVSGHGASGAAPGPAHLPSHLVLVTPSESADQRAAAARDHSAAGQALRSGQNPRERAAAAAVAAAAPAERTTAAPVSPPAPTATPTPSPAPGPRGAAPTSAEAGQAPVSRWTYAGLGATSGHSTTPSTSAPARASLTRATTAAAGTTRSTPAPGKTPTRTPRETAPAAQTRTTARASAPGQQGDRASFLRRTEVETPARHGWRGALNRIGLKVAPSADERAERADIAAVAAHWAGHRTVAVVNGKGGSSKSPTTALLCAAFARHGGTGVVAWENNQTRGTLGWRTEQGPHDATLLDLMPAVPDLLSRQAGLGDFAAYTHHQITDRYAVLRAQPKSLADEQRISPDNVTAVHEIAAKFNRLIVMDSGNDESDPMWRRMIDHTDQLVVPTTTRDDHAEAAALLLEGLARGDAHRARLAAGAVVVVSQANRSAGQADLDRVADGFADLAREVVTVRFDPAMVDGVLRWDTLHPTTQRDWLRAGAAVARGL